MTFNSVDSRQKLEQQISRIQLLVGLQRSARTLIRAAWFGILLYLIVRELYTLLRSPSIPDIKIWIGLFLILFVTIWNVFSWPRKSKIVWSLDRRLGYKEQISTAWAVNRENQTGIIQSALVQDVRGILPRVFDSVFRRGWYLSRELLLLGIAILLWGVIHLGSLSSAFPRVTPGTPQRLPPVFEEPRAEDLFSEGRINMASQEGEQLLDGEEKVNSPPNQAEEIKNDELLLDDAANQDLTQAFNQMGQNLSEQAATYELGQSFQRMELTNAANDIQKLADKFDSLSLMTKEQITDTLREGADRLEDILKETSQTLPEDLGELVELLSAQANQELPPDEADKLGSEIRDQFDKIANDLRTLDQSLGNQQTGSGWQAGSGGSSGVQAEPAERLQGEGEFLELPVSEGTSTGLQSTIPPDQPGTDSASQPIYETQAGGEEVIENVIEPTYYLWKWQPIIAAYFIE